MTKIQVFAASGTLFLSALFSVAAAAADSSSLWSANIYGLAYHFERAEAKRIGASNEVNPGLGIRRELYTQGAHHIYGEAGIYYDSGRRWAKTADVTWQYELIGGLRGGIGAFFFYTPTYNRGKAFVAPVPVMSYDFGPAVLSVAYAPKYQDKNVINTLGAFVSWRFP